MKLETHFNTIKEFYADCKDSKGRRIFHTLKDERLEPNDELRIWTVAFHYAPQEETAEEEGAYYNLEKYIRLHDLDRSFNLRRNGLGWESTLQMVQSDLGFSMIFTDNGCW